MTPITTRGGDETQRIGEALASELRVGDLVVLSGDLGAGKTTIAKGIARGLGVQEHVTSPTFTIVQEYRGAVPVAHVDVYRLTRAQEVYDLGLEELLERCVVLIEWGDAVAPLLAAERIDVRLAAAENDDERKVTIDVTGPDAATRRAAIARALDRVRSA